jgi:hypothetical protein
VLSLVISVGAAILAWSVSNRQNRLQARMLELEEARERDRLAEGSRAQVSAMMRRSSGSGRLYIDNSGPAAARNIRVTLDDKPIDKHPYIHEGQELIAVLGPGAHSEFIVKTHDAMPTAFHCQIAWDNPNGDRGFWESELSFLI